MTIEQSQNELLPLCVGLIAILTDDQLRALYEVSFVDTLQHELLLAAMRARNLLINPHVPVLSCEVRNG